MNEIKVKDMVDPKVYQKVDLAAYTYERLKKLEAAMNQAMKAEERIKKRTENEYWDMRLSIGGTTVINLDSKHVIEKDVLEIFKQSMTLLESICYGHLKDDVRKFNNSLKDKEDGK